MSRRGMYTPHSTPSGPSHSTEIRCAAFSLVSPVAAGAQPGRTPPIRSRQIPATAWPRTSWGRSGAGSRAAATDGSTR